MQVVRHVKMAAALGALAIAGLGALLVGCCLYLTVSSSRGSSTSTARTRASVFCSSMHRKSVQYR